MYANRRSYLIHYKSKFEIERMRDAGKLAAEVLYETSLRAKAGVSTLELNDFAHQYTIKKGAESAPLHYKGFPKSICTSINDVVCHGIPKKDEILKDGDIINIDITVKYKGYHGDTSKTLLIGNVSEKARKLVEVTEKALWIGIETVKPNVRINEIGTKIEEFVSQFGYSVVRELAGHGIGKNFHEDPIIPHYKNNEVRILMKPGMTFTIEPMINEGTFDVIIDSKDKWTVRTADGKLSAQFEHTILVTEEGYEVLTLLK